MELPLCLVYLQEEKIIGVNGLFESTFKNTSLINKSVNEVFTFEKEYTILTLSNYTTYLRYTLLNNVIALTRVDSKLIDSNYFVHSTITPLTNVIELTKILENTSLTQKQKEYISIIKMNNFELTKNINDITKFLTYFGKGVYLYYEPINLKNKIEYIIKIISNIYKISVNINFENEIIFQDKEILFDILYHILFYLVKNTKAIDIYYEDKKIIFSSASFNGEYEKKMNACEIHSYNYNDSLDLHIVKICLKLVKWSVTYSDSNKYILSIQ